MLYLLIVLTAAMPIRKEGPCPNNYSSSANFCMPNADAGPAVFVGPLEPCPSGMSRDGHYCVGRPNRR